MLFGLQNAPGKFQLTMSVILWSVKSQLALMYLEDIAIFSKTPKKHIYLGRKALLLLYKAVVTLKLKKCNFFTDTNDYIGQVTHTGRFQLTLHTTDSMRELKQPTILTELRSFLGLWNVFRRFVRSFARVTSTEPITRENGANTFVLHNSKEFRAVDKVKIALISAPVVELPYYDGRMTLDTSAWNIQIGSILLQKDTYNTTKPLEYWSRLLTKAIRLHAKRMSGNCLVCFAPQTILRTWPRGT